MSNFYIHEVSLAATASQTSAIQLDYGEPVIWAIKVPAVANWCVTATCNIRLLGAVSSSGTYVTIGYSQNPATGTSETFRNWEVPISSSDVVATCEAAQFMPWVKIQATNSATVATSFYLIGRKINT